MTTIRVQGSEESGIGLKATIPKAICKELGIHKFDELDVQVVEGNIIMQKIGKLVPKEETWHVDKSVNDVPCVEEMETTFPPAEHGRFVEVPVASEHEQRVPEPEEQNPATG